MEGLDKRLSAYAQRAETPPPMNEGALRARLAQRRAAREARLQIVLYCILAGLCALMMLLLTALVCVTVSPRAAMAMGLSLGGVPLALALGGAVLRQTMAEQVKKG